MNLKKQIYRRSRMWPVVCSLLLLLSLGLTAPSARAACPIQGCDPGSPEPVSQPPKRDAILNVFDQTDAQYHIIYVRMDFPSIDTKGNKVMYSRTAWATNDIFSTATNYYDTYYQIAHFKGVRIDTSRTTTFTAYGKYANGTYGYKIATARTEFHSINTVTWCRNWFIWADNSTMQAPGFYPNSLCS